MRTESLAAYFAGRYLEEFGPTLAASTRDLYATSVAHWEEIVTHVPLGRITREHLLAYRQGLLDGGNGRAADPRQRCFPWAENGRTKSRRPPLKPATVNKHLRQIGRVLATAGPAERGNPHGLGLIDRVPAVPKLRVYRDEPRDVPDETLSRLYNGCVAALYPAISPIPPCDWWQALITTALVSGCRRGTLLALEWDQVDVESASIQVRAEQDKAGRSRSKRLGPAVIDRLLRLRTPSSTRVFAWPHSESTWRRTWWRIQREGRIAAERRIRFHDLKRASLTRFAATGASIHAVQIQGDHASIATSQHYVNARRERDEAIDRLTLPVCYRAG
jgi:integrase